MKQPNFIFARNDRSKLLNKRGENHLLSLLWERRDRWKMPILVHFNWNFVHHHCIDAGKRVSNGGEKRLKSLRWRTSMRKTKEIRNKHLSFPSREVGTTSEAIKISINRVQLNLQLVDYSFRKFLFCLLIEFLTLTTFHLKLLLRCFLISNPWDQNIYNKLKAQMAFLTSSDKACDDNCQFHWKAYQAYWLILYDCRWLKNCQKGGKLIDKKKSHGKT